MNLKRKLFTTILSITIFVSAGCVSLGQKIDPNKVATIQKYVTTESEIRALFGEPVASEMNMAKGTKILAYGYKNDDSIKKGAAGTAGEVAGGVLGSQVGDGIGGAIGSMVGGILASNAVTARQETQYLEVTININSGIVEDFNYIESKGRTQKLGVTSGVDAL